MEASAVATGQTQEGPQTDSATRSEAARPSRTKELRLGLVCYGGVSLAIYMHGITVELQRLVHASNVYCAAPHGNNPFSIGSTERVYWQALNSIAKSAGGVELQVVLDVIAGTSAGGINGVALAKALACGVRQDPLREVWLTKASIFKLLVRSPRRMLRDGLLPPLNGSRMSRWAFEALSAMNQQPVSDAGTSLMPPGHALELFVTTTDCNGYRRTLELYNPDTVHDLEYRHVLRFRHSDLENQFDRAHDRALTLAIRCTSSFPGAFPPVTFEELREVVGDFADDAERKRFCNLHFSSYLYEGAEPEESFLVDGGVLNNKPFDHAVRAIAERPASHEVDRRLLFIQPHPKEHSSHADEDARRPGWLATIFAALSSIPSHQPIADALARLAAENERARDFQRLIAVAEDSAREMITKAKHQLNLEDGQNLSQLEIKTLDCCSGAIQEETKVTGGASFHAYEAIKLSNVISDLADGISAILDYPADSRPAALVRRMVQLWADGEGVLARPATPDAPRMTDEQRRIFLRSYDLDFRRRRIRFLVRCINEMYRQDLEREGAPSRALLDEAKSKLYGLIKILRHIQTGGWIRRHPATSSDCSADGDPVPDLKQTLTGIFGWDIISQLSSEHGQIESAEQPLTDFVEAHRSAINKALGVLQVELEHQLRDYWDQQQEVFTWLLSNPAWPESLRQQLLERYVGFPYWDAVLYPLVALSGLAEIDPIEVIRFSPADARLLEPKGAEARLKGIKAFHFNAFFRRKYRENDFLWGRLDGVERILWVLNDAAQRHSTQLDPELSWQGFRAVLESEQSLMRKAATRDLIQRLLAQVEQHDQPRPNSPQSGLPPRHRGWKAPRSH